MSHPHMSRGTPQRLSSILTGASVAEEDAAKPRLPLWRKMGHKMGRT